jgi:hypothetical protein
MCYDPHKQVLLILLFCIIFFGCNLDSLLFYIRLSLISYLFIWVVNQLMLYLLFLLVGGWFVLVYSLICLS